MTQHAPKGRSISRLYIRSCAIGFAAAGVFVALLLALDVARLGSLVMGSPDGWLAAGMLWAANGIVFAGVQFGFAIMSMSERDTGAPGGRAPQHAPIPVRVERGNR